MIGLMPASATSAPSDLYKIKHSSIVIYLFLPFFLFFAVFLCCAKKHRFFVEDISKC